MDLFIAHFMLFHLARVHLTDAAIPLPIAAGTDPFSGVAQALLDIANTVKVPFAAIAFIIAGVTLSTRWR